MNMKKDDCCDDGSSATKVSKAEVEKNLVPDGSKGSLFSVSGMDCGDEVAAIKSALKTQNVVSIDANIIASKVTVFHTKKISSEEIARLIETTGVKVVQSSGDSFFADNSVRIYLVAGSGFSIAVGFSVNLLPKIPNFASLGFFAVATLLAGILVFPKAWRALLAKNLDMNVLMSIAVVGAFGIKEYSEAASVAFLFAFAELLEAFSVTRARKAIQEVLNITPQLANLEKDGQIVSVPVQEVKVGDIFLLKAGERIPLDGKVVRGESSVNQAPLTGESVPVEKAVGDTVFAGTVNENGSLSVAVTQISQDTKISKIIRLVEDAQKQKAPSQKFVDKFSTVYTPVVFLIAIVTALFPPLALGHEWHEWIYRSLVFLVIACPCALVIATPVSIVSGLTAMARRGVLVKGGIFLEALGKLRAIALDKTGTITEGKPKVQSLKLWKSSSEAEVLEVAASLDASSTHPLALALVSYAKVKGVNAKQVQNFSVVSGRGVRANLNGHDYFLGNHRYAHELGVCTDEFEKYVKSIEELGQTVVAIGHMPHANCPGEVLGIIGMGDTLRPQIKESLVRLHEAGIENVVVLSGDNQRTVNAVIGQAGIDKGLGDLLPEDKVTQIRLLVEKFKYVGMVGDGINDAPALAQATVGIAMGAAGTDTAIETADVALMKDDLSQLAVAVREGKRCLNVIRFNIGFSLLVKAVFLILAFLGISNLWLAIAADTGASILVTLNALRLLKVKE